MELTTNMYKERSLSAIDMACMLIIGLGLGVVAMYWYVANHPDIVSHSQTTIILMPKKAINSTPAGQVIVKPSVKTEQI